jgi:beta-lactamase class C
MTTARRAAIAILFVAVLLPMSGRAAGDETRRIATVVELAIRPVMDRYGVPGMAAGVVSNQQGYVYDYGVASKTTGKPVTSDTLFEIGSVSKAFTATLAAYAQVTGRLSLADHASHYLAPLRGSSFDKVSLLNLGTHTTGGLPLQVPDDVTNDAQLMAWFKNWKPDYAPGSRRVYTNLGIGLLGIIAAKSLGGDFVTLMHEMVLSRLGLQHTYFDVPEAQAENYAQGYTKADLPVRMAPGVLAHEAYGIRTTAGDLLRFVEANMRMLGLNEPLQRAITLTHTGYYRADVMTQDLIWEQFDYPVGLNVLLAGNSARMLFEANPVTAIDPPLPPRDDVLIDKTGSTNGFAAYVAFVPGRKLGVVLLANKNYPIAAQVTAAYQIITQLDGGAHKD